MSPDYTSYNGYYLNIVARRIIYQRHFTGLKSNRKTDQFEETFYITFGFVQESTVLKTSR